jgi:hypothetical protein
MPHLFVQLSRRFYKRGLTWFVSVLVGTMVLSGLSVDVVRATPPHFLPLTTNLVAQAPAPAELQALLGQIDTAASRKDLAATLAFYGNDFKNSDGLTRTSLEAALAKFWKDYDQITYKTQINSWQSGRDGLTVETTTAITGSRRANDRPLQLTSTLTTRQRIVGQKVVSQEILAEQSQVKSGTTPPTVQLSLPTQVQVGQDYNLDAIVQEPLRDSLLLGVALDEPVSPDAYLRIPPAELDLLSAGGLFKVGKAPAQPGDRWISVALVRDSGMTMITQRLKVVR